jgi:hypothetical protein
MIVSILSTAARQEGDHPGAAKEVPEVLTHGSEKEQQDDAHQITACTSS